MRLLNPLSRRATGDSLALQCSPNDVAADHMTMKIGCDGKGSRYRVTSSMCTVLRWRVAPCQPRRAMSVRLPSYYVLTSTRQPNTFNTLPHYHPPSSPLSSPSQPPLHLFIQQQQQHNQYEGSCCVRRGAGRDSLRRRPQDAV